MLPENIHTSIEQHLNDSIINTHSVFGGDINQSAKLEFTSGKALFIKWNLDSPEGMFEAEAKGLKLLKTAETGLVIPNVHFVDRAYLLLDWIEEQGGLQQSAFNFGRELAKLHKTTDRSFGLDFDNYIGRLPQSNYRHSNWYDFFAIERIEPQVKMGVESGKLSRTLLRDVQVFYKKLGHIFPVEQPALLHGDLWSGNYMYTKSGKVSIYDPAVYFGHREMDLAMTRLFGGFSANFYNGYKEEFPLEPGFDSRVQVYNLYPILVHANFFGGTYCRQAEEIILRYS